MKKILNLLLLLAFSNIVFPQSYVGFLSDNYSGVHGVISNPANIVDSRFKTDVNLAGVSALIDNDYASIRLFDLTKSDFDFNKSGKRFPLNSNNAVVNVDILGPSFMFNIKPKHSLAISTRVRGSAVVNDLNGGTVDLIENKFKRNRDYLINEGDATATANTWAEVGLTYATVLFDKDIHFVKGGITLKYIQGLGNSSGNGRNLSIDYKQNGTIINGQSLPTITSTGTLNYGYTSNFENKFKDFKILENATGFGTDLGFIYEWRPNAQEYKFKNNNGVSQYYKDVNKYKVKVGLSVTDIGSINYKNAKQETYDITKTVTEKEYNSFDGIKDKLQSLYTKTNSTTSLKANLPTALHFNADWNIKNKFYLNLDTNFDISGNKNNTSSISNSYILTPRYESKWFSAYVPVGIYELSGFQAGFGLRAGPLYVGSGSIITNLINDQSKAADVYVGLKVPIYQSRPKDKDGDGVFDKVDNCPKVAGPAENNGCPWGDKDGDSVLDNVDNCPKEAGPAENNGCPWGDKDKDGVLDNVDKCPTEKGDKANNGCPDTDGDGVVDKDDKCPKIKGDKANNGCPADADGDGIADKDDKCPKVPGVAKNNGCPEVKEVITKKAKETISSYAKAIYFNSARSSFKPGVSEKLDMIVDVMKKFPEANFAIEGHTDSQGAKASNQRLSDKRAKAVLDYLVRKGISPNRISSYGFGEEYPIDTNSTRAGRANNRRVEIKLRK